MNKIHAVNTPRESKTTLHMALVSPMNAETMLTVEMWGKQRVLRSWHVNEIAEYMKRGEFTEGTQIHFAKLNGKSFNINGQHTLCAIKRSGVSINLGILITEVESEEEIAVLYSRHDRHLARTLSDSCAAFGFSESLKLTKGQIDATSAGIRMMLNDFTNESGSCRYENRSTDSQLRAFKEYGGSAKSYFDAIKGAPKAAMAQLRSKSIVAVAIKSFELLPERAAEFWSQVALNNGLLVGDPRKTLIEWLMGNRSTRQNLSQRSHVAARAWNVWVSGGSILRFRLPDITKPLVLNKV